MNVLYQDMNGRAWRFDVDGTPYQTLLLRRILAAVGRGLRADKLTLSYLADCDANDAFCGQVEAAILSGLAVQFRAELTPPAPQDPPPPQTAGTAADPPEREPYYWENF